MGIAHHFRHIEDPRLHRNRLHDLEEILVVTICGVICGCDNWVAIEDFAKEEVDWFRTLLPLPNGIPSHDTLSRVFGLLDSDRVSQCFIGWMQSIVATLEPNTVVAIDGKTLRRSFATEHGKAAVHMLSAYAAGYGLVLGQKKVDDKSNEITAIPELLRELQLRQCIVTTDAMGCQTDIAKAIIAQEADYLLQVKGNQGTLHKDLQALETEFSEAAYFEEVDGEHGRIDCRRTQVLPLLDGLEHHGERWCQLRSLVRVCRRSESGDRVREETRFYISSLSPDDPRLIGRAVRRHWSIENELHWTLDVAFREDDNRTREANAAENLAVARHVALNLLKSEKSWDKSIPRKRQRAAVNRAYRLKILTSLNN